MGIQLYDNRLKITLLPFGLIFQDILASRLSSSSSPKCPSFKHAQISFLEVARIRCRRSAPTRRDCCLN